MSATKHCNLCGQTKPLAEFYTKPNGQPRAGCKTCLCADSRRRDPLYYREHAEACKAKTRRWIENNRARYNKTICAAVKRYRRRRRDRGQTFLALDSAPVK
jgi:hypothetical protein